ncbi:MAG: SET domain-containing protein-lysine N-methyltransferase [Deltaproteobacteria bacterium]|nr:SET domain-containing protein-lysine N-methyltransferase [Deltaproteobacteria bacterium]
MILNETDDRFYLGDSTLPGAGKGLFAKVPLKAGDRLAVIGVLVPVTSDSDACTRYADEYKFRVGDHLLIPVGHGAMVNHSASPNLEKIIEGKEVYLRLLRNVQAGEELLFTYSNYAQERFGLK